MPLYTYECENCGQRFEAKQSFADAPLTVCPECKGKIHRVIQPVGVVFKGSGFYVTDSKAKQTLATSGSKKEDAKPTDGGSDTSSTSADSSSSGDSTTKSETATKADTKVAETKSTPTSDAK